MTVLLSSVTELSLTNALERVVGPTFITLSYAASRVQRLRRPELSCDLGRYAGVLRQYEVSKRSREHCHVFYTDLMTHWSARSSLSCHQVLLSLRDTYSILDWRQGSEQSSYDRSCVTAWWNPYSCLSPPLSSRHAAELLTPGLQPDILKHNVRSVLYSNQINW